MSEMIAVNFVPEPIIARQTLRRHVVRWTAVCAAAFALVLVPVGMEGCRRVEADELRRVRASVQRESTRVKSELAKVLAEAEDVFLQLERANALRSKRAWSGMFHLMASAMPPSSWLTSVETDPAAPSAGISAVSPVSDRAKKAGDKIQDRVITIEAPRKLRLLGYAKEPTDPLAFVQNLNATGVFDGVSLQKSNQEPIEDGYYFRFEILCEW